MAGQLNGSRPVRLEIVVKNFAIAGAVQRILIGGGRGMIADANLVDARTGAFILAHRDLTAALHVPGGLAGVAIQAAIDNASERSPADKVADQYGENYRNWLLRPGVMYPGSSLTASPLQSGRFLCLKQRGSAATPGSVGV